METPNTELAEGAGAAPPAAQISPEPPAAPEATAETSAPTPRKRRKESGLKTLLRVVISLFVIAAAILLLLYIISRLAHYDSISSMLSHMFGELSYMWQNRLR